MALRLCTKPVDGSIPVPALLYNDEELVASQDGVGIYQGAQKSMDHQNGMVFVTSHRLFYVDAASQVTRSFALELSSISRTDFYAGLLRSNPKVTLYLSAPEAGEPGGGLVESWECAVCAFKNPPGLSPSAAKVCALCGVPRDASPAPTAVASDPPRLSSSIPAATTSAPSLPAAAVQPANRRASSVACPACTFLNHPSLRSCEICDTELPAISHSTLNKSAPSSRPPSPDIDVDSDPSASRLIKVSFRKGGEKPFYASLKQSLQRKAWQKHGPRPSPSPASGINGDSSGRFGISGILNNVQASAEGEESSLKDALQDLEGLRVKAKDMVRLAGELNEKLTASSTSSSARGSPAPSAADDMNQRDPTFRPEAEPEEATFIRSSLSQLGLQMSNAPVTMDMIKDERQWMDELARELANVLQGSGSKSDPGGMMKERGVIALDEVWGGWNRARGVALIPPTTFLQVVPQLRFHTSPTILTRKFPSGLTVLHTPLYTPSAFSARLSGFLVMNGPKSTIAIAQEEGITIGLAAQLVEIVEESGDVVRDDAMCKIAGGGGVGTTEDVLWWPNLFTGYVWDGEPEP